MDQFTTRLDLQNVKSFADAIKKQIATIVIGQEKMVELMIVAVLSKGHILIEGVPGIAKTLTAKLLSKSIDTDFSRIQFTPDLMPSDVLGTSIYNPKDATFSYRKGPIFSNIVLIDEVNRAPAKTQAALFEVMEERQVSFDGETYLLGNPFFIVATQNPIDQEGTYRLPEAQLDRFFVKIEPTYPSKEDEITILSNVLKGIAHTSIESVKPVVTPAELQNAQETVGKIIIEEKLLDFITTIVQTTRNHPSITLGASPRASLALLNGSRALAGIRGRDFVTPEDIIDLTPAVLRHRIIVSPEKEMEGISATDIVKEIVARIEIPR